MPQIRAGDGRVTHINVFTVDPKDQQALVDSLTETIAVARTIPGWISASLHRSLDGRQVTNYVQFESEAAAVAVNRALFAAGLIQRNVALGSVAPGQYEVVSTLERED
jgi:hypothetical protein